MRNFGSMHWHKHNNGKAIKQAAVVGGCSGEKEIAEMWAIILNSCTAQFSSG